MQGLALFRKQYPQHRSKEIDRCIAKAIRYIENMQNPDGSWYVGIILLCCIFCSAVSGCILLYCMLCYALHNTVLLCMCKLYMVKLVYRLKLYFILYMSFLNKNSKKKIQQTKQFNLKMERVEDMTQSEK